MPAPSQIAYWTSTIGTPAVPGLLRTLSGSVDGEVVAVDGFWTPGDGGGGLFFWDALSTTADNLGFVVQPTGVVTGRWKRIVNNQTVSVKWFGAKGDGGTDDTASITAALNAATNYKIWFPLGIYRITSALTVTGRHLEVEINTEDSAETNPTRIVADPAVPPMAYVLNAQNQPTQIENLAIDANGVATLGIRYSNVSVPASMLSRVVVQNAISHGFYLLNCQETSFECIEAIDCGGDGIRFEGGNASRLTKPKALNNGGYGINIIAGSSSGGMTVDGPVVEATAGSGGVYIDQTTSPCQIANGTFNLSASVDAITLNITQWARVENNAITYVGNSAGKRAVKCVGACIGAIIRDNAIESDNTTDNMIEFSATSNGCRAINNTILGTPGTFAPVLNSSTSPIEIATFYRSQAAAVPPTSAGQLGEIVWNTSPSDGTLVGWIFVATVANPTGEWVVYNYPHGLPGAIVNNTRPFVDISHVFTLTGAANPYELRGGYEGKRVTLIALGVVSLLHLTGATGNIRLAGGVNYAMTAGRTCTLVRITDATFSPNPVWIEIGRN
jgi:hypothetical protein